MAKSINQAVLLGNLTADPDFKTLPSGQGAVRFSLALNRSYPDKEGQTVEVTTYLDVVAYGKLAEQVSERLTKGSRALVEGRIDNRTWDDKETGQRRSKYEILANDVTFLDQSKSIEVQGE
jgi:single-strand DNA-binding protein